MRAMRRGHRVRRSARSRPTWRLFPQLAALAAFRAPTPRWPWRGKVPGIACMASVCRVSRSGRLGATGAGRTRFSPRLRFRTQSGQCGRRPSVLPGGQLRMPKLSLSGLSRRRCPPWSDLPTQLRVCPQFAIKPFCRRSIAQSPAARTSCSTTSPPSPLTPRRPTACRNPIGVELNS